MSPLPDTGHVAHVYAHYPFCRRKCPYCDFNSHAGREAEVDAYLAALRREAKTRLSGHGVRTIYVGGGTPTHCDAGLLERYLEALREAAGVDALEEFTVEANPGSFDVAKASALRRVGVNRLSLGVQSLDDRHLRTLGRGHDAHTARRAVDRARDTGIEDVSLDVILAIPGQTAAEQARDLAQFVALEPTHVSAYVLTIEEGTEFGRAVRQGALAPPDPDRELTHLRIAASQLPLAGLRRYEVSNYAREGMACRHNLAYWRNDDWIGLGAGAHSHVGHRRWKNVDDPLAYARGVAKPNGSVAWIETAPPEVAFFESLLMGLRLVEGVDLDELASNAGLDPARIPTAAIEDKRARGLLHRSGPRVRASTKGLEVLSWVLTDLVPDAEPDLEVLDETARPS